MAKTKDLADRPPRAPHVPTRTCVGCRQRDAASALVRVRAVGAALRFDGVRGRGAWIHPRESCVAQARKSKAFGRALRAGIELPDQKELIAAVLAAGRFQ
jgi:uncharacterized protein